MHAHAHGGVNIWSTLFLTRLYLGTNIARFLSSLSYCWQCRWAVQGGGGILAWSYLAACCWMLEPLTAMTRTVWIRFTSRLISAPILFYWESVSSNIYRTSAIPFLTSCPQLVMHLLLLLACLSCSKALRSHYTHTVWVISQFISILDLVWVIFFLFKACRKGHRTLTILWKQIHQSWASEAAQSSLTNI